MNITAIFLSVSLQYNLPPKLLDSLCYIESNHKVDAINHDDGKGDSIGICQVKYETAKWLGYKGTVDGLFNPEINIKYAGKYLARQLKRYENNIERAVIAYNQGSARSLTKTRYSSKVLKKWRAQSERKPDTRNNNKQCPLPKSGQPPRC